ncbi:MAG: tRNA epoxyqueuosine(34) reductase QueG [Candidatus Promineifilaceae bacterium]
MKMIDTAVITTKIHELGFDLIGATPAKPAHRLDAYLRWVEAGMYGRMDYMARPDRIIRRKDLNVILPGVQTIITVALNYYTQKLPPAIANAPSRGRIANYAWNIDYHDVMTPRLQAVADWLDEQTGSTSKVYVDTGAILERDHGEQAGLGFTGKNSMLIHPRRGSFFFLGEILTTLNLQTLTLAVGSHLPLPVTNMPSCGVCHRCQDACPTNAFSQPYVLDARRCISYLTIELKGWIPLEMRPLIGNWIYGCDVCQDVCPFNRFAQSTAEKAFWPDGSLADVAAPPLLELLQLDEAGFKARFAHSPIKRIKHGRFLRNVCVAVGNWGSKTAVPHLIPLLAHPDPIVRGHAAWALHQIGGSQAKQALAAALQTETDPQVRQELSGSLP